MTTTTPAPERTGGSASTTRDHTRDTRDMTMNAVDTARDTARAVPPAASGTGHRALSGRTNHTGMRGLRTMARIELRVWMRDAGAVFFGLLFPTVLLVGIGLLIPGMRDPIEDLAGSPYDGLSAVALMLPALLAVALATPALNIIPATIATNREKGVLKRLSTTPMRPQGVFATSYLINLGATLVSAAIAYAVGLAVFGLAAPRNIGIVLIGFTLGLAAMFAVGTLIAARAQRGTTASAIGTTLYFPMLLMAGLWTPGPAMPELLATIARFTPLGASAQVMTAGWFTGELPWLQVAVMVAWTALLVPVSVRIFRWS